MNTMNLIISLSLAIFLICVIATMLWNRFTQRVLVWDFQTVLHYKNGKYAGTLEPGMHRLWGTGHSVVAFDKRVIELVVQGQELITADSATLKLSAVVHYWVDDARKFHEAVEDGRQALYTQVQLALREVLGALELDVILAEKAGFAVALLESVRANLVTEALGIEIKRVVLRDLMLGGELKSALSSVLTSRKEAQAKQEKARGDAAVLRTMANAARVFENNPELLRMRYLDTLKELGSGYNNALYIGLPEDVVRLATAVSKD